MAILNTPLLGLPYAGADTDETYAVLAALFVKDGRKLTLPEIVDNYTPTIGTVYINAADWTAADGTADEYDAKITISGVEPNSMILIYPATDVDAEKAKRLGIRAKAASGVANDDTFVIVRATGGDPTVTEGIALVYIALRGYAVWSAGLTPPGLPYATVIGVDPQIATEEGDRDDIAASQGLVTEAFTELRISLSTLFTGLADTNKALELRLKSADLQTKLDEYRAAKGLIDKTVSDLVNYYTKSQTLTKDEINALVSAIPKFSIEVVASLPTSNISDTTVYLVKSGDDDTNLYIEYIRTNGKWEKLGTQTVDLTGYATEAWVNTILAAFVKTADMEAYVAGLLKGYVTKETGKGLSTNDYTDSDKAAVTKAAEDSAAALARAETAESNASDAAASAAEVQRRVESGEMNGEDGVSPIVEVTDTPKSVTITIIGADGSRQTGTVSIAELEQNLRAEIAAEWANRGTVTITAITSLDEIDRTDSVEAHSKLYLYEGNLYAYMRSPTPGGEPLFTNALNDPSVTKKINTRWSDSGNKESTNNGYYLIHDIPATAGQTVYVNLPRSAFSAWYSRVQYHDVNKAYVSATTTYAEQKYKITTDENGVSSFVVGYQNTTAGDDSTNALVANSANIRYIVLALCVSVVISPDGAQGNVLTENDVADLIVSVGNPIAYSEPDPNNWEWKAAMAFPNIDGLSNKVAALEATSVDHETRIYEVEQAIANGGIVEENLTDSEKLARIKNWNKVVTDKAPVTLIAAARMKPAMTEADRTVAAIHNKYTALAEKYPSLITKTVLGPCTSTEDFPAVDMLRIDVKETDGERNAVRNQYMPKRKIILLAGIHWEWVGIGALYHFIEEVAENPDYGDIRSNAHLIVVPVANPYGATSKVNCPYDAPGHINARGVAIHNNFGVDYIAGGTVGTYNYGGTAPYSELETQYIDAIMAENPDAVAFISCHNCDGDGTYGTGVMWASVASAYTANVAYHVVDKMSDAWYGEYGENLLTAIDTYKTADLPKGDRCLGRVSISTSAGTEQKNALKYGIQGLNFEVTHNMPVFSGKTSYTTETMTHATEVYANLVRTILFAFDASDKSDQYKKS